MTIPKTINAVFNVRKTLEGAGVHLRRGFANAEVPRFDPFLLFDDFSSSNPTDYLAGFPMHPHRGMETVTYILDGDVRHRDSMGNSGIIGKGDVQWMTAGSGIIHEEMPEGISGLLGFQLWINLPKKNKMMSPRYQEVKRSAIPEISLHTHAVVRVIAGKLLDATGPVHEVMAQPLYLDISLQPDREFVLPVPAHYTTFVYIFSGTITTKEKHTHRTESFSTGTIILFDRTGDTVHLYAGGGGARFLLVSGQPLNEPIAWHGPIVMNTSEEIEVAFNELQNGEFIK